MAKEIKEKMLSLQEKAIKEFGKDSDILITTFKDGHCGSIMRGDAQNIAHSLFALIHDPNSKAGIDLYRVIKLVVLNIVSNESPFAADLLTGILNAPAPIDEREKDEGDKKAVLVQMPKRNEKN